MGLDTTHDCWHGSYNGFHHYRVALARIIGVDLVGMEGFTKYGKRWSALPSDSLHILLSHSDCDGSIEADDCLPLANRMEELLKDMSDGNMVMLTRRWITGLREAASKYEDVEFH